MLLCIYHLFICLLCQFISSTTYNNHIVSLFRLTYKKASFLPKNHFSSGRFTMILSGSCADSGIERVGLLGAWGSSFWMSCSFLLIRLDFCLAREHGIQYMTSTGSRSAGINSMLLPSVSFMRAAISSIWMLLCPAQGILQKNSNHWILLIQSYLIPLGSQKKSILSHTCCGIYRLAPCFFLGFEAPYHFHAVIFRWSPVSIFSKSP